MMKPKNSSSQLKALVVDDDRVNRMTHQALLKKVGVENLASVENGKKAVELYCNGESFDLILMDKDMPVMNGIEATKQLRSMGIRDMIVGVSSSSRGAENVQQFMEAGLDEYYTKPLTVDTLKAILDKIKS
ncbi:two-component response regulator ARR22 isoform X2 [Vigna radiata var. radiata]|nr:two-component response regulator ARR22 isoform X2 [Vigna radiata var. radiata]XP_014495692.1 two-component response regulator ARR22 isoform X2 [Vigna radiata var. radiata]